MNLTALLSSTSNTSSDSPAAAAAAAASKSNASSPLSAIQKRIQTNVDSTKTQLSAFGVLKSAVSQSQTAAQALGKLGTACTEADTTKAMASFFNDYNAVVSASQKAADSAGNSVASGTSTSAGASAGRVGKYFQRTLASGTTLDALKKLGLSTQSDGTLVQDAKQFAQNLTADPSGVRAALAKLGSAVDATANKELNPSGTLGDALGRLNQRTTALAAQQKALSTAAQNVAAYKANS
jgi:hypothetical protein